MAHCIDSAPLWNAEVYPTGKVEYRIGSARLCALCAVFLYAASMFVES